MPLISIVLPVYNAGRWLSACLQSILAQTERDWELLAVDDGSADDSAGILQAYAAKDPRIRVLSQPNRGVCAARNRALECAQGEYIAFVDADDVTSPELLRLLLQGLRQTGAELCCCRAELTPSPEALAFTARGVYRTVSGDERFLTVLDTEYSGYLWNKLFLRSVIETGRPLRFERNVTILEDQVFVVRYLQRCGTATLCPDLLYGYRYSPDSAYNRPLSAEKLSVLPAREMVYQAVCGSCESEAPKALAWNLLMRELCVQYRTLQLHPLEQNDAWLARIEERWMTYRGRYPLSGLWAPREKLYYYMVGLMARLHRRKGAAYA